MMVQFGPILLRRAGILGVLAGAALATGVARAEVNISPLRQVITDEARTATYRVSNPSNRIIEGRLRWIDLSATETGYVDAAPEQRENLSAAPYLTVWPAFFRLEPGADVTVTVAAKADAPLPAGEHRSHLLVETDAVRTPLRKAGGSLEVDIGLGISTPVILRGGKGDAGATIGETHLLRTTDGSLELETNVEPKGEFSAYGRIDVVFTPRTEKGAGAPEVLRSIDNVAAYIDAPRRRVMAPLGVQELPGGVLEVRYVGRSEFEGETFATRSFEIAPPR